MDHGEVSPASTALDLTHCFSEERYSYGWESNGFNDEVDSSNSTNFIHQQKPTS